MRDPVPDMIRFLYIALQGQGHRNDCAAAVCGPGQKRGLSLAKIRRLNERLEISGEVLIRPSRNRAA
jgi:hypothetical protein